MLKIKEWISCQAKKGKKLSLGTDDNWNSEWNLHFTSELSNTADQKNNRKKAIFKRKYGLFCQWRNDPVNFCERCVLNFLNYIINKLLR